MPIGKLSDRILRIGYEATLGRRITDDELNLLLKHTSDDVKKTSVKHLIPPIPPSKQKIKEILGDN